MSTPPSNLPPPPSATPAPSTPPTQIVGQQTAPSTTVPHVPGATGAPMVVNPATQFNTLAIVSLATGMGSFFAHIIPGVGGLTVAIIAVVTGYMARNQIKQSGEQGMWMATAGMVIGIIHIVGLIALVVLVIMIIAFGFVFFGIAASHSG